MIEKELTSSATIGGEKDTQREYMINSYVRRYASERRLNKGIFSHLENEFDVREKLAKEIKMTPKYRGLSVVERVDLASDTKKPEQQKSFVERMRGVKDGGKSRNGHNEL